MRTLLAVTTLLALCGAALAAAEPALQPGKWEATVTTTLPNAEPASQTIVHCIDASNTGPVENMVRSGNCTITQKSVIGTTARWEMDCKSKSGEVTHGRGEFTSDGVTGSTKVEMMSTFQGQPIRTITTWTGKRLGDCPPKSPKP